MVVSMVTGLLRNRHAGQPAAILAEMNELLIGSLHGGFVTVAVVRCARGGEITIASAGRPSRYLDGIESGLPLGIAPAADWPESSFPFGAGRQLTQVSDGVIEAANAKGELFGFDRTREISGQSAKQIADISVVTVRRKV